MKAASKSAARPVRASAFTLLRIVTKGRSSPTSAGHRRPRLARVLVLSEFSSQILREGRETDQISMI
jgi:hypothetical protein